MSSGLLNGEVLLIFMPKEPDEKWVANIKARYPGLEVRWVCNTDTSAGKERPKLRPYASLPPAVLEGVTMLCTGSMQIPTLEHIKDVKFVQLISAGTDKWANHEKYLDPNVCFCTANGVHAPQISEWVMGTWLMAKHDFLHYADTMKRGHWEPWNEATSKITDSVSNRMGILGYGAIGRQCARLATSMGMEVYAYTRSPKDTPEKKKDDSYCVPGTGDPDGLLPAKWFQGAGREAINDFLAQDLDLLVISLPLTPDTTGLIGGEQFDLMSKKKTFVVNIARGKVVETEALIEALEGDKIMGAALDVTDPEPLPEGHPLWNAKNVFITPHVSWATPANWERCISVLEQNLEKVDKGETPINLVNKKLNY